jgi:hypothetical protein
VTVELSDGEVFDVKIPRLAKTRRGSLGIRWALRFIAVTWGAKKGAELLLGTN